MRLRIVMAVLNVPGKIADHGSAHWTRLRPAALLVRRVRGAPVSPPAAATPANGTPVRSLRPGTALRAIVMLTRGPALLVLPPLVLSPLPSLLLLTGT
jgi:hypothetical protein